MGVKLPAGYVIIAEVRTVVIATNKTGKQSTDGNVGRYYGIKAKKIGIQAV